MTRKVCIILNEWSGYALHRRKKLGFEKKNRVQCGLGRILKVMQNTRAGVEFELHIVVNGESPPKPSRIRSIFNKLGMPATKALSQFNGLKEKYPFITEIHYRSNKGMDIGAYNYGINYLRNQGYDGDILLMNSSVVAAKRDGWLLEYQNLFYSSEHENIGLCGISMNSHNTMLEKPAFKPHLQSFFLYTNINTLNVIFGDELSGSQITGDKSQLIEEGEIGISQMALEAGYGLRCSQFPEFVYYKNTKWAIPEGDLRYTKEYGAQANLV